MSKKRKVVCLPVEVFKREFLARFYLALKLVKRGYTVIVGNQEDVVFESITSGFYLHKDHAMWSAAKIQQLKAQGLVVGAVDEEGIIYWSEEIYLKHRAPAETLALVDAVFLWGEKQRQLIDRRGMDIRQEIVGNPRFDILHLYRKEVRPLGNRFSKILINTRFATVNNIRGDREISNLRSLGLITDEADFKRFTQIVNDDRKIYNEFCALVAVLSKANDVTITVRPHPAEKVETYKSLFAEYGNVFIDNHTPLPEQLVAHDCLIHDGCTTAIEAAAMGIPVLGLRPTSVVNSYGEFANRFSVNFTNHKELAEYVQNTAPETFRQPDDSETDAPFVISNWQNKSHSAVDRIADVIDSFELEEVSIDSITDKFVLEKGFLIRKYSESISKAFERVPLLKDLLVKVYGDRAERLLGEFEIKNRKFPFLSKEIVDSVLFMFCRMDPSLGDASDFMYRMKSRRAIILSPRTADPAAQISVGTTRNRS